MKVNRQQADETAKQRIVQKSHELSLKAQEQLTLNAKCMLCVENLKLQLQILKIDFEERQKQQAAQETMMKVGMRVNAQSWSPQSYSTSSGTASPPYMAMSGNPAYQQNYGVYPQNFYPASM